MTTFTEGLHGKFIYRVQAKDLAQQWGNPFPVLSTPSLLWLAELAAMKAIEGHLTDDQITLGLAHNSKHLAASFEGADIEVSASLTGRTEKTLDFDVQAYDGSRPIFSGTHSRALISRQRFLDKLDKLRAEILENVG
jgi:fluoroacetyl-CoA thioesterase